MEGADQLGAETSGDPSEGEVLGGVKTFDEVFDSALLVPDLAAVGKDREYAGDVESASVFGEEATCGRAKHFGGNGCGGRSVGVVVDVVVPAEA